MTVSIRYVAPRDEARWRELFDGYVTFYKSEVPPAVVDLTWQRLVTQADNMTCLVATGEDDRPLGFAALVFHRSTWSPTWYCYLEDLFVDPSVRGGGVGQRLIEGTYEEAGKRGATRTYWATQEGNATARHLYDQMAELTDFVQYRR
jgi:GNAT superfamily N-acetyltransferase